MTRSEMCLRLQIAFGVFVLLFFVALWEWDSKQYERDLLRDEIACRVSTEKMVKEGVIK